MFIGCIEQLCLGAHGYLFAHGLFEVGVEALFGVEFRAVAGQVKKLDLVLVFFHPVFDRFAVMHPQIVEDEEHFPARISISLSALNASSIIIQRALP